MLWRRSTRVFGIFGSLVIVILDDLDPDLAAGFSSQPTAKEPAFGTEPAKEPAAALRFMASVSNRRDKLSVELFYIKTRPLAETSTGWNTTMPY